MRNRLVLHLCALCGHNGIVLIYISVGDLCKCDRRSCFTDGTGNSFALDRPLRNPIGIMNMCLWEAEIKVGVYSLNLRLASLILTIIDKLWFWWLGALTGSVSTTTGFIRES